MQNANQAQNARGTEASFELAIPPSINHCFANVRGVGRVKTPAYKKWISGELKALMAQRARPVQTPVAISMFVPEASRADLSNHAKSVEDLLVKAGVIPDDSKKYVRSVSLTFHDSKLLRVTVKTLAGAE